MYEISFVIFIFYYDQVSQVLRDVDIIFLTWLISMENILFIIFQTLFLQSQFHQ